MYKFLAALVFILAITFGLWVMPEGKWAQLDDTRTSVRAAAGEDYWWLLGAPKQQAKMAHKKKKKKKKKVAKADANNGDGEMVAGSSASNITIVVSPDGRYVDMPASGKMAAATSTETMSDVMWIGSPSGRYVDAVMEKAPMVMAEVVRIESPAGRYVTGSKKRKKAKKKKAKRAARKIVRISSPGGRYVSAPKRVKKKKRVVRKIARVSSPGGRYVSASKVVKKKVVRKIVRISSPGGRYVSAPKTKKTKRVAGRKLVRIGSPGGRYVSAQKRKKTKRVSRGKLVRIGSPGGRYVSAPAVIKTARRTETGALAFPIQFIFATSDFTQTGKEAADELLAYVKSKGFNSITLSGHTDSIGTESDNLGLSKRRLDAVSNYLSAGGYRGEVNLMPKGESEPFTGVDRDQYSGNALREFDRRVELRAGT